MVWGETLKNHLWKCLILVMVLYLVQYIYFIAAIYVPTLSAASYLEEHSNHNEDEEPPVAHFYKLFAGGCLGMHTVLFITMEAFYGLAFYEQIKKRRWCFTFISIMNGAGKLTSFALSLL